MKSRDSFATVSTLFFQGRSYRYFSIPELSERLEFNPAKLPFTVRILMENMLRSEDGRQVKEADIRTMARAYRDNEPCGDIAFKPTRVLMQDFTGVPSVADLAAMRDALGDMGGDPGKINPQIPVELVIDHSVQLDRFGTESAFAANASKELKRNRERYGFLNWGQKNLKNFSVIPPATGICHQVNLEYLGRVVTVDDTEEYPVLYPDTLVGLDSHTTMINGIGVLGWGVGGIEAEAVMLGQPYYMPAPDVLGFELTGRLQPGVTATDLVLTITEMLRQKGVVGRFVEFFGPGLDSLTVPDRATIANMSPEFGATAAYFPVDEKTLEYLLFTGRPRHQVDLAASYLKAQQLFFNSSASPPAYCETMQLALETVEPCLAGPRRPQDRIALSDMKQRFQQDYERIFSTPGRGGKDPCWEAEGGAVVDEERWRSRMIHRRPAYGDGVFIKRPYQSFYLDHGSVVIAAITSCTNTSNPAVLLGAGLVAKKAVKMGLQVRPWVKASLTPGSRVVSDYLEASGLMAYLEALRFHVAAYGCSTCIGNSGPLQEDVKEAVKNTGLVAAAVLSGNRNYEGRINSLVQANYLASPMLVVAYALAGTVNFNPQTEPIGHSGNNEPVYLKDIWPSEEESLEVMGYPQPAMFVSRYAEVFEGDENWRQISAGDTLRYQWDADSEYLKRPPFFGEMAEPTAGPADVESARVLAMLGDSITTDHISPAGAIAEDSPAGKYLLEKAIPKEDFNSYGSRRGNHEVMLRGTFANPRLQNRLVPDTQGGFTRHFSSGKTVSIFDAAVQYAKENTPLIIIAGKEYGSGSSRDWAAKGTLLLGVRAVIAESFERIHRANLVAMGVLPLEFAHGENAGTLGITGEEMFDIRGISNMDTPGQMLAVEADAGGSKKSFAAKARLDFEMELEYFRHGGILAYVLRQMKEEGER